MISIYDEISTDLNKFGWKSNVNASRGFPFIAVKQLGISLFIIEDMFYIVRGSKLPPTVKIININKPGLDIVEAINKECSKIITNPLAI